MSMGREKFPHGQNGAPASDVARGTSRQTSITETYDLSCKVMLIGDSGVGKTCLLVRFKDGTFLSGSFISTVGIDFRNKVVDVEGTKVKLQIWDTAGQERFRSITRAYYRDANALLLLYDVTNKTSFDNMRAWLGEINDYAQDDVVIMLLGNKCDVHGERVVKKEDGERLAKEYGVAFMETSAKTGVNVELAFMAVASNLKSWTYKVRDFLERYNKLYENCKFGNLSLAKLMDLKIKKKRRPNEPKFSVADYVEAEKEEPGCCKS